MVSLAKDVQVDLGHLRLQAHHLHLQEEGQGILARVQAMVASSAKVCGHNPFSSSVLKLQTQKEAQRGLRGRVGI